MLIFFVALPCSIFLLGIFLARSAWKIFSPKKFLQIPALALVVATLVIFLYAFLGFLARDYDSALFAFSWNFFAFAVVPLVYLSLWALAGTLAGKIFPRLGRFKFAFAGTGVALVAAVCIFGFLKFENPETHFVIWDSATARAIDCGNAEKSLDGKTPRLRLVATADWHLGERIGRSRAENFVALVNAQNPDAVVIAGDFFDSRIEPVEAEKIDEVLREIRAPQGVFATFGNHEYFGNLPRIEKFLQCANIRVLRDETATLAGKNGENVLTVFGRDDATNKFRVPAQNLLAQKTPGVPALVLDHQPREADALAAAGADFVFCGHTHGGQFFPATQIVHFFNRYVSGLYFSAGKPIFVTTGLGLWHIPYRIGCAAELVVIDVY